MIPPPWYAREGREIQTFRSESTMARVRSDNRSVTVAAHKQSRDREGADAQILLPRALASGIRYGTLGFRA